MTPIIGGEKLTQVEPSAYVICNPEKPYQEYVIVSPDNYKEGLSYEDYSKIYKPIQVVDSETF